MFQKFLRVNENNTKLLELIVDCVVQRCTEPAIISTEGEKVVDNRDIRSATVKFYNHEEAKKIILLYVQDAVQSGFKKVIIVANDTDVVVISLYAFFSLGIDELWLEYDSVKHRRWLSIHTYAGVLGEEVWYVERFRFSMLLPAVTQFCCLQEGERRHRGKVGTIFQRLHRALLGILCLKQLL